MAFFHEAIKRYNRDQSGNLKVLHSQKILTIQQDQRQSVSSVGNPRQASTGLNSSCLTSLWIGARVAQNDKVARFTLLYGQNFMRVQVTEGFIDFRYSLKTTKPSEPLKRSPKWSLFNQVQQKVMSFQLSILLCSISLLSDLGL